MCIKFLKINTGWKLDIGIPLHLSECKFLTPLARNFTLLLLITEEVVAVHDQDFFLFFLFININNFIQAICADMKGLIVLKYLIVYIVPVLQFK